MDALGGDPEAEALLGHRLRGAPVRGAPGRRRAGDPLLRAEPGAGTRAVLERAAGVAAVGAGRARATAAGVLRASNRLAASMAKEGSFRYRGHRVAYEVHGEGDRVLVLAHGLLMNRRMYDAPGARRWPPADTG